MPVLDDSFYEQAKAKLESSSDMEEMRQVALRLLDIMKQAEEAIDLGREALELLRNEINYKNEVIAKYQENIDINFFKL